MITFLTSATFDFSKANKLSENDHQDAFIKIFEEMMLLLKGDLIDINEIEILLKHDVESSVLRRFSTHQEDLLYSISVVDFYKNISFLAADLYISDNREFFLRAKEPHLEILVAMDPIYFSIKHK